LCEKACRLSASRALALSITLIAGSRVCAESAWILTNADFRSEPADIKSIDASGLKLAASDGEKTVRMEQFLQLDRAAPLRTRPPMLFLCLAGGDRIGGQPIRLDGEQLHFRSQTLGELVYPLRQVRAIQRPGAQIFAPQEQASVDDVIRLANGDSVRGIISDVSADAISIQAVGGEVSQVSLGSIVSAEFAATSSGATSKPLKRQRSFRVTLADGTMLSGAAIAASDAELRITLADGSTRPVPMSAVAGIEQLDGPVVWLSALSPSESVQTPYFGDRTISARMDRNVSGEVLRSGAHAYARGIGVHSYSRLTFDIDDHFAAFRTQFAIDGDLPFADVTARILVDGQPVWEKKNIKAGPVSAPAILDIATHKTLTLEVDYGENYDVQDRFNWIEPALLRTSPTTAPSTQPQ
jgi:NPCBM/NEW2 domain-containing protein